jgi:TadE-like protein
VIELVLYTPLLMFVIFLTVQAALLFLGNQAAEAAARDAARVARAAASSTDLTAGGSQDALEAGEESGLAYAHSVGAGILLDPKITMRVVGGQIEVVVTGTGIKLVPGVPGAAISQRVLSPIEEFRPDDGVVTP